MEYIKLIIEISAHAHVCTTPHRVAPRPIRSSADSRLSTLPPSPSRRRYTVTNKIVIIISKRVKMSGKYFKKIKRYALLLSIQRISPPA